jgi:hypothetical protein
VERTHETAARTETADQDIRATLAVIQDQSGQTLELLRTLISLILPELGGRDGPPLEELIARMIVQQGEILTIARRTQRDVRALGDRLRSSDGADRSGYTAPDGKAPSC